MSSRVVLAAVALAVVAVVAIGAVVGVKAWRDHEAQAERDRYRELATTQCEQERQNPDSDTREYVLGRSMSQCVESKIDMLVKTNGSLVQP